MASLMVIVSPAHRSKKEQGCSTHTVPFCPKASSLIARIISPNSPHPRPHPSIHPGLSRAPRRVRTHPLQTPAMGGSEIECRSSLSHSMNPSLALLTTSRGGLHWGQGVTYLVGKWWVCAEFVLKLPNCYPPGKCWANLKFAHLLVQILPGGFFQVFVKFFSIYLCFQSLPGEKPTRQNLNKEVGKF